MKAPVFVTWLGMPNGAGENEPLENADAPRAVLSGSPSAFAHDFSKPAFIAFLVVFAVTWTSVALGLRIRIGESSLAPVFVASAAVTSLVGLGRRLPGQNVVVAGGLIAGLACLIETIGVVTNVPFGPRIYTDGLGVKILSGLPWTVPLLWVAAIINGRGVARLIVRPWRKTTYYGFWVIGLTSVLVVGLDLSFEPFASVGHQFWFWRMPRTVFTWYTAPWVNFLGCLVTATAVLGFTTPWLINKQPVKQPTDYHPLVIWLLWHLLFGTDHLLHARWAALGWTVGTTALAVAFAVRGARW